jgi:hypothetical protein
MQHLTSTLPPHKWPSAYSLLTLKKDGALVNTGADFALMPSLFEPSGIVQQEFFSGSTPVVAFKTGGLKGDGLCLFCFVLLCRLGRRVHRSALPKPNKDAIRHHLRVQPNHCSGQRFHVRGTPLRRLFAGQSFFFFSICVHKDSGLLPSGSFLPQTKPTETVLR